MLCELYFIMMLLNKKQNYKPLRWRFCLIKRLFQKPEFAMENSQRKKFCCKTSLPYRGI